MLINPSTIAGWDDLTEAEKTTLGEAYNAEQIRINTARTVFQNVENQI